MTAFSTGIHNVKAFTASPWAAGGITEDGGMRLRICFQDSYFGADPKTLEYELTLFAINPEAAAKFARLAAAITEIFADEPAKQETA